MKLNEKLFAHMRSATRGLLGQGPVAATETIQKALSAAGLSPPQSAPTQAQTFTHPRPVLRDINAPPESAASPRAAETSAPEPSPASSMPTPNADLFANLMPDLLARMEQGNLTARNGFTMPSFDLPGAAVPETWPGNFIDGSFTNPAGTRSYKLYVPSTYTGKEPVPLVVMLHGCTQDPVDFASGTQMNALAEEMQCLVVYPAQSQQANAQRCWNWFSAVDQTRGQGEPSIIAGITSSIIDSHAVDPEQVYVAGLSAGGAMATIMGTLYPELYAAVGVHSGLPFASANDLPSALAAMKGNFRSGKPAGEAIPIIVFHGDKDTTVHPANGDELIARGAPRAAKRRVTEPGRVPDGHAYTRIVHHDDDGTPHAEQWLIHGAGHAWSGGSARGSYTDGKGPDASREMMRFFRTRR